MAIFKVTYSSMTARYGPSFIEAESELEARRKFAGNSFSSDEMGLISARQVSSNEIKQALRDSEEGS